MKKEMKPSSEEVKQTIKETFQKMGQAMAEGDAQKLATNFTEDAFLKFPEQEPLQGREAIAQAHEQMLEQKLKVLPATDEVFVFDNMAFETGTYKIQTSEGNTVSQGHYGTLWKMVDGNWQIHRDMISSVKGGSPVDKVTAGAE